MGGGAGVDAGAPIRLNRCEVLLQRAHEINASSEKNPPAIKLGDKEAGLMKWFRLYRGLA